MTNTGRNFHYLEGTGNATTDTAELQSALSYASALSIRQLVLNGNFAINEPLECDTKVRIEGFPYFQLTYEGDLTTDPILSLTGYYSKIRNGWLNCNHLCRGLYCYDMHDGEIGQDLRVIFPRQIGLYGHDCWYGSMINVEVNGARGVGVLLDRCNSSVHANLAFKNCWGYQHASGSSWDPSDANHIALWTYGSTHTYAETEASYGADFVSDWPSTGEVPAADRACLVVLSGQDCHHFRNIAFEPCNYGELPVAMLKGTTERVETLRVEGGYYNQDRGAVMVKNTAQTTIDNMLVITTTPAGYAVELEGVTDLTSVNQVDCRDSQVLNGILYAPAAETHTNYSVTNSRGTSDGSTPLTEEATAPPAP